MTWRYRVMRTHDYGYGIHEVYCSNKGDSWTEIPEVFADTKEGLRWTLESMLYALHEPEFKPKVCAATKRTIKTHRKTLKRLKDGDE